MFKLSETVGRILEITFVAVILYLILANAFGFSSIVTSLGNVYVKSVGALQGRTVSA